jgi:serine/threonine protein kinase
MQIEFLNPKGPLRSEIPGIATLAERLPNSWRGYANFNMVNPRQRNQDREIDLAIITPDRVILVDLKAYRGRVESRRGVWFIDNEDMGPSAAVKIHENAKVFASLVREKVKAIPGAPRIESFVVFTDRRANFDGVSEDERGRCVLLDDFARIGSPKVFEELCPTHSPFGGPKSLLAGGYIKALAQLFTNERHIVAREVRYHGYLPTGTAEFSHNLYEEFSCHDPADKNYTGLLRVWNFGKEPASFALESDRAKIAGRERSVLGLIASSDPEFHGQFVLRSRVHDRDFTLRYSEIFDRHPDLARLMRFAGQVAELDIDRRLELARLLLDRVASLHRLKIAHRDLDRHSIWVDDRRSLVVLSNFGASHFPDTETMGEKRAKILAGGLRVPEEAGQSARGTPFEQDVFLAAAAVWTLLTGQQLTTIDRVPSWPPSSIIPGDLPPELLGWFERSLSKTAADRFSSATEASQAFADALSRNERISLDRQLKRHTREIDTLVTYSPAEWIVKNPHRVYRSTDENGVPILVKSWPAHLIGEPRKNAPRLLDFLIRAERLQAAVFEWLPRVEFACLALDGLLLVQRWSDGERLSADRAAGWTADGLGTFLLKLVEAVESLHLEALWHGDLKPANVLVVEDETGMRPVLIDMLDYSTDAAGERVTQAYQPAHNGEEPAFRDRYAVAAIASELAAAWSTTHPGEVWGQRITEAAEECGHGDDPWITLRPLRNVLVAGPQEQQTADALKLTIVLPRVRDPGALLADNGKFHVAYRADQHRLEIFGFDQKVELRLDPGTGLPRDGSIYSLPPKSASWAARFATLAFEGSVTVLSGAPSFSGFEELRALLAQPEAGKETPPTPSTPVSGGSVRFPVASFWEQTIAVESDLQPEVTLSEKPRESGERRRVLLLCDEVPDWEATGLAAGRGIKVTWNGEHLGYVDRDRSRGNVIVLRDARGYQRLNPGDVLRLHTADDHSSFQRRSKAVERVLKGRAQIGNLIGYFDPEARLEPQQIAAPIPEDDLAVYGLNPDQSEAFQHLWQYGPVGLLQGPPGTGKTKFIAAFVHWALSGGRLGNVLVLSQSHEAVNTAAEKVLGVFSKLGGNIDLLRVGNYDKISSPLRGFHSQAVQDRYRELFRADIKDRMAAVAQRLGLSRSFVTEFQELEATYGSMVRAMRFARRDIDEDLSSEAVAAARRNLSGLERAFFRILDDGSVPREGDPEEIFLELKDELARSHGVSDPDALHRLEGLTLMSRDWISGLSVRQRNLEEFLARSRNLVSGTCVGIGRHDLRIDRSVFDLVIIDEAARCTPSELAVGMQSGRRVLLVGDHRQLPPLFGHELMKEVSTRLPGIKPGELKRSDFERAFGSTYGKSIARTLRRQYRMASEINSLVADNFYPGQGLQTARSEPDEVYGHLSAPFRQQVLWVDTSAGGSDAEAGKSFTNRREAHTIIGLLRKLSEQKEFLAKAPAALPLERDEPLVGVICMYAQQANLIEELLVSSGISPEFRSLVRVDTVDAYQGKENRLVIVSLVRNNTASNMGHVRNANRVNVALSRAMDRLLIVGSAKMFEKGGNALAPVVRALRQANRIKASTELGLSK